MNDKIEIPEELVQKLKAIVPDYIWDGKFVNGKPFIDHIQIQTWNHCVFGKRFILPTIVDFSQPIEAIVNAEEIFSCEAKIPLPEHAEKIPKVTIYKKKNSEEKAFFLLHINAMDDYDSFLIIVW